MRLILTKGPTAKKPEMILEHRGAETYWDVSEFHNIGNQPEIVEHINAYWETLSLAQQDWLFARMTQINQAFGDFLDAPSVGALIELLKPLVAQIVDSYDLDKVRYWVKTYSNVIIPNSFPAEYVHNEDKAGSREKTYTKDDYLWLVVGVMALRLMVPIWGEFLARTKGATDTIFKEYYAMRLLDQAQFMTSTPMAKLREYMQENIKKGKSDTLQFLTRGLSSEDFPEWMYAMIVVRRICVADIRGEHTGSHVVSNVWKFIESKYAAMTTSSNTSHSVQAKTFDSGSDEQRSSRLEAFKIRQTTAVGRIVYVEHFLEDPWGVVTMPELAPGLDAALFAELLQEAHKLENLPIQPCQVLLAQCVLEPVLSPRAISAVSKRHVINALVITQATLLQRGHRVLAALCTATQNDNPAEVQLSATDPTNRIPKELLERLEHAYPHHRMPSGRTRPLMTKDGQLPNEAVMAIDELFLQFSARDWVLNWPARLTKELTGGSRRLSCPADMKVLLARLTLDLYDRA